MESPENIKSKMARNKDFIKFLRTYKLKDSKYKELLKNKPNIRDNDNTALKKWYAEFLSIFM